MRVFVRSKVRCWDPELSEWTSEGIEEAEWQPARRVIRVHTTRQERSKVLFVVVLVVIVLCVAAVILVVLPLLLLLTGEKV